MTKSEEIFETFLTENNLGFEKIQETTTPRPDYLVTVDSLKLAFEVTELMEDDNFHTTGVSSRKVGEHIRSKITNKEKKKQLQWAKNQGIPAILLLYNRIDPVFQLFGTDYHDFIAAMYGDPTLLISTSTGKVTDQFYGRGDSFREGHNTSFSALGHLWQRSPEKGVILSGLILFENVHAAIKIPYDRLPTCFEVKKFEMDVDKCEESI